MVKNIDEGLQSWTNLLGFQSDIAKIKELHETQRMPQVILFTGREGIGKRMFLSKLVGILFCETGDGCGSCSSCVDVQRNEHTELLYMEEAKSYKLEHIQRLQEHLSVQASSVQRNGHLVKQVRAVVIPDIDRLNAQGANRLLKTLEEPPANTMILLSTSRPKQLLDTILSRVIKWHLEPAKIEESLQLLKPLFPNVSEALIERTLVESGLATGRAKSRLERDNEDENLAVDKLIKNLLFSKGRQLALDASKELIKGRQINANDLARRIELLLNDYYKWRLSADGLRDSTFFDQVNITIDAKVLRQWRKSLSMIRKIADRGGVPLNAQLLAETFALTR